MSLSTLHLNVLFFSVLRDLTGCEHIAWEMPAGSTLGDLLQRLYQRWPQLAEWDASLLLAIDQTYARRSEVLPVGAEIALMPPVQGG